MTPAKFPEATVVLAKNQSEYLPLPAAVSGHPDGVVATCWRLSIWERLKLLITGRLWIEQMTFHRGFPPIKPATTKPDFTQYGYEE